MAEYTVNLPTEETAVRLADALEGVKGILELQDSPLEKLDGTAATYKKVMRQWFIAQGIDDDSTSEEITAACGEWYRLTREEWTGYTEFYNTDVSALSTGTKGGDNADLACTPSTDTEENADDYAGLPLFACVDVNWEIDEETLEPVITAIEGITTTFKRTDTSKYVGVMQMSPYYIAEDGDSSYIRGLSALPGAPYAYCAPAPEAVRVDGTFREWVVHAKYMSAPTTMTCCSGTVCGGYFSHNNIHTRSLAVGTGYSGSTVADDMWLKMMAYVKYGSLTLDGILQGCVSMSYQYPAQVAEEGVKRVLVTASNGADLEAGMRMEIGYYDSTSSSPLDRGSSSAIYSVSGSTGALITSIEDVTVDGTTYSAVYFDTDDTFDTAANGTATEGTTYISSLAWDTGKTDTVKGNDGSPVSCTSGKYPAKLQGIEYANGVTEVYADVIISAYLGDDGETYYLEPYVCRLRANQSTAVTDDYETAGEALEQAESAGTTYIKRLSSPETGRMWPVEVGGSSSTYTRDGLYRPAGETSAREWRAFGCLTSSVANGGLSYLLASLTLSAANWINGARLSPTGNRGEWTA